MRHAAQVNKAVYGLACSQLNTSIYSVLMLNLSPGIYKYVSIHHLVQMTENCVGPYPKISQYEIYATFSEVHVVTINKTRK